VKSAGVASKAWRRGEESGGSVTISYTTAACLRHSVKRSINTGGVVLYRR